MQEPPAKKQKQNLVYPPVAKQIQHFISLALKQDEYPKQAIVDKLSRILPQDFECHEFEQYTKEIGLMFKLSLWQVICTVRINPKIDYGLQDAEFIEQAQLDIANQAIQILLNQNYNQFIDNHVTVDRLVGVLEDLRSGVKICKTFYLDQTTSIDEQESILKAFKDIQHLKIDFVDINPDD